MYKIRDIRICPSINKFLILLFFIGLWIRYYTDLHILVSLPIFALFGASVFILYMVKCQTNILYIYYLMAMVDIFALLAVIINANHTVADVILLISWQSMGLLMYEMKTKEDLKLVRYLAVISLILIYLKLIMNFKQYEWGWMILSTRMGSNSASIFILEFIFIDLFWRISDFKKIRYYPVLIALIMALVAGGIVGIITIPLLIIGIYIFKYNKKFHIIIRVFTIIAFLGLCISFIIIFKSNMVNEFIGFIKQGDSSSRILMWKNYYQLAIDNITGLIWGANISGDDLLIAYRNLHNCFFNWHYFYGLIPFVFFVGIIIYDIKESIQQKQYIYMIIIMATIFRSMSDEATYAFMPIWIFVFCDLYSCKRERLRKQRMNYLGGHTSGKIDNNQYIKMV